MTLLMFEFLLLMFERSSLEAVGLFDQPFNGALCLDSNGGTT